jgi:hypothetical protein
MIVFFGTEINPLDKYWQAGFVRYFVVPANAGADSNRGQLL